MNTASD